MQEVLGISWTLRNTFFLLCMHVNHSRHPAPRKQAHLCNRNETVTMTRYQSWEYRVEFGISVLPAVLSGTEMPNTVLVPIPNGRYRMTFSAFCNFPSRQRMFIMLRFNSARLYLYYQTVHNTHRPLTKGDVRPH